MPLPKRVNYIQLSHDLIDNYILNPNPAALDKISRTLTGYQSAARIDVIHAIKDDMTLLAKAAKAKNFALMDVLLSLGADPNNSGNDKSIHDILGEIEGYSLDDLCYIFTHTDNVAGQIVIKDKPLANDTLKIVYHFLPPFNPGSSQSFADKHDYVIAKLKKQYDELLVEHGHKSLDMHTFPDTDEKEGPDARYEAIEQSTLTEEVSISNLISYLYNAHKSSIENVLGAVYQDVVNFLKSYEDLIRPNDDEPTGIIHEILEAYQLEGIAAEARHNIDQLDPGSADQMDMIGDLDSVE